MNESYEQLVSRLAKPMSSDLMDFIHMTLGATSEAGELADAVKATLVYGRDLDFINVVEEVGDALFYLEGTMQKLGLTLEDAKRANMAKLNARYQEGYSDAAANNRKKEFEREAIAQAVWGQSTAPALELDLA